MYIPPKVKPLCPPEQPPRFEDVTYAQVTLDDGSSYDLKLDIYQAADQTVPGPCVVYFFGGGFMWGEYKQRTQKAVYCRDLVRLTAKGYTVVCPDYRLASQSLLPACIHDAKGVIRFLKANGLKYNIDPERIGALGNSAGGHLAAMIAFSANHPEMEGTTGGNLEYSSSVKAACIFYSPADMIKSLLDSADTVLDPKDLVGSEIENLGNDKAGILPAVIVGYTGPGRTIKKLADVARSGDTTHPDWHFIELTRKCSPIHYVSADCPPVAIFHGGHDPIVAPDHSLMLYLALVKAGADATFVAYSHGGHGPSLGEAIDQFAYQFMMDRL